MVTAAEKVINIVLEKIATKDARQEDQRRLILLYLLSIIGIVFLMIFAFLAFRQNAVQLAILDMITAIVLTINLFDAAIRKKINVNIKVGIIFISVLYIYLYMTGGVNNTAFVWYFTYPLISCYLLGSKLGGISTALMIIPVFMIMIIEPKPRFFANYNWLFLIRFVAAYSVIGVFSYLFERTREINQTELDTINQNLETLVEDRTNELLSVNTKLTEDIKKRKMVERKLEISEKRYRTLFEKAKDAIFILDISEEGMGKIVDANQSAAKMHGYTLEEIKELNISHLNSWEDSKKDPDPIESIIKGNWNNFEIQQIRKDGSLFSAEVSAGIIEIEKKRFLLAIYRDISERKEFEKRLRRAEKMEAIGALSGGIAHDFNNILLPIIGNSEMVLSDMSDNDPFKENIKKIYSSAVRARELVLQILTFSSQKSDETKPIKLDTVITEAVKMIRSTIPSNIEILTEIDSESGYVEANTTKMHQVIMNILTNSYHSIEKSTGRITIQSSNIHIREPDPIKHGMTPGDYVCLTISDTGIGMDDDTKQRIFEPFFTTKKNGKGTGLGLSVVHGIVKNMNGEIIIDSTRGQGTTFKFYFPMTQKITDESKNSSKPTLIGSEKILFVDDEEEIITVVKAYLERQKYSIICHSNPKLAIQIFKEEPSMFDLVVTDLSMPDIPGNELAEEIKKIRPDIPVIMCTGFSNVEVIQAMKKIGINHVLNKPFDMIDLAKTIREVLDIQNS